MDEIFEEFMDGLHICGMDGWADYLRDGWMDG